MSRIAAAPRAQPLRVLYVEHDLGNVGGSLRSLAGIVRHLDRARFTPYVTFTPDTPNPMRAELEDLGCRIVFVGARLPRAGAARSHPSGSLGLPARALERALDWARDALRGLHVLRALRRERIDLVHANNHQRANWYGLWAARRAGVPVVSHQRFMYPVSAADRRRARRVAAVICNSDFVREALCGLAEPARMHVVHNGVAVPVDPAPARPLPAAPRVALVGRLVAWKGPDVFLRAVPAVAAACPEARFLLAGGPMERPEGQAYVDGLRRLAEELGVADRVTFLGYVHDVDALFRNGLDVVVHASVTPEPFGRVLVEAMAAGRPVVASDDGGCREIVEDGVSGLLFRPGDPEALAKALVELLRDPELAPRLVRGGNERVRARFDEVRTSAEVQAIYAQVLGLPAPETAPAAAPPPLGPLGERARPDDRQSGAGNGRKSAT